ncbi:MAG: CvpA family protein [Holosporales bacterium]|jgi:membrane protein required for colicin V production|nr:CvpA family protein [Holosporales bacterium]
MNTVDFAILGVISISGIIGFAKGFVRELSSILAWILAGVATFWDIPFLRTFMQAHFETAFIANIVAIVLACVIAFTIVSFIGTVCAGFIRGTILSPIDRIFGALLSSGKCVLLLSCVEIATGFFVTREAVPDSIAQSTLIVWIYYVSDQLQKAMPEKVQTFIKDFANQKSIPDDNFADISNSDPEVENLGTLAPKTPDDLTSGAYTSDQRDRLNIVIQQN